MWWPILGMKQSTIIYNVSKDGREKGPEKVLLLKFRLRCPYMLQNLKLLTNLFEIKKSGGLSLFIIDSGRANGN